MQRGEIRRTQISKNSLLQGGQWESRILMSDWKSREIIRLETELNLFISNTLDHSQSCQNRNLQMWFQGCITGAKRKRINSKKLGTMFRIISVSLRGSTRCPKFLQSWKIQQEVILYYTWIQLKGNFSRNFSYVKSGFQSHGSTTSRKPKTKWKSGKGTPSKYGRKVKNKKDPSPYTFRPQLSKKSLKMAERMGKSRDRLLRPKGQSKSPMSRNNNGYLFHNNSMQPSNSKSFIGHNQTYDHSVDTSVSFRPRINSKSRKLDKHSSKSPLNRSFNRFERLYMNVDQQNAKISALKSLYEKESILKDIEDCTFTPHINNTSTPSSQSFVERNKNWVNYKQHKIAKMKDRKVEKERKDCTFKPQVSSFVSDNSNICMGSTSSEAIEKFLNRQKVARNKKEESQIYEEYIRNGGSACTDSYAWKAHKTRYKLV